MGLIRFLLAISVAIDHFGGVMGFRMGPGSVEVEAFFIISGFYMALVLQDRYAGNLGLFYTNRYLRLFPSYACILIATLVFGVLTGAHNRFTMPVSELAEIFLNGDLWTKIYIVVANLSIVFLDLALFLSFDGEALRFTEDFRQSAVPVYQFLLIPQGWSLGLELYFYAVAPFLLSRTWRLAAAFLLSIGVFIALATSSLPSDPWTHRFFPSILFLFLAGSMSWKVFRRRLDAPWVKRLGIVLLVLTCLSIVGLAYSPFGPDGTRALLLSLVAASVGPVFALSRNSEFDRAIGDLSYPIYVAHLLAFTMASHVLGAGQGLVACVITIGLSLMLVFAVERPIERFRNLRIARLHKDKAG